MAGRDPWLLAALALAAAYVAILAWTAPSIGFVRDEGYYFKAAELYFDWVEDVFREGTSAFADTEILEHFEYNNEHPPLVKLSQGLGHFILHDTLGWASDAQAFRFAGFLFGALALLGTFALGRRLMDGRKAWLAAAWLATVPRFFFDAHLATFDVAITALWVWSLWAFHRACTEPGWGPTWWAGGIFGLALATKLNAFFLPFVFLAMWAARWPQALRIRRSRGPTGFKDWVLPGVPKVAVAVGVIGAAVFFVTWPYLWHDPLPRFGGYLRFHLGHEHYPISYFGTLYVAPPFPWHFPWVMTALTLPLPLLFFGTMGWIAGLRRLNDAGMMALLVGSLLPIAIISLPNTPIFGGTKHWYNALPTLCILAARWAVLGWDGWLQRWRVRSPMLRAGLTAGVMLLWLSPGIATSWRVHPHGIAAYNSLAGGVRGAAALGMQRAFWGGVNRELIESLPERGIQGRVFFNRTNYDAYRMYRRDGVLPPKGIWYAQDPKRVEAALHFEQPEHGESEAELWESLGTRPVAGVYVDNVTLGQLYVDEGSGGPPAFGLGRTSTASGSLP